MKCRSILTSEEWRGFAVNFLAVVLGIALTFLCEGMISRHSVKSRVKDMLGIVVVELEDTKASLSNMEKFIEADLRAAEYLEANWDNLDTIPADSLVRHGVQLLSFQEVHSDMLADDLMRTSDVIQGIDDVGMLLEIEDAYLNSEIYVRSFNMYYQEKNKILDLFETGEFRQWIIDPSISDRERILKFLRSVDGRYLIHQIRANSVIDRLGPPLSKIDKALDHIALFLK